MFLRVLRFNMLPMLLILIYAIGRFLLGLRGVPYAPRGNAIFSVVGLSMVSSIYFGALSKRVGNFSLGGSALVGLTLGLFAQLLIFSATFISYAANLNTYYLHWDALNIPEGTTMPMATALAARARGLLIGPIFTVLLALLGRALSGLAPKPDKL